MPQHTGILSEDDYEFLLGKKNYDGDIADQKRNQKRYRIRKKMINAFYDFEMLRYVSEKDRKMIIADAPISGIDELLKFIYRSIGESDNLMRGDIMRQVIADVEDDFAPPGMVVDKVQIELSYTEVDPDIDKLRRRVEEGERLTDSEIGALVRAGAITPEEIEQYTWDHEGYDLDEIEWERSSAVHPREE